MALGAAIRFAPYARVLSNYESVKYEGLVILGGTGVGKSRSSGELVAKRLLTAGDGGVVLAAKPDDLRMWANDYFRRTGRDPRDDLVVVGPQRPHPESIWPGEMLGPRKVFSFNVLDEYERGGRIASNLAHVLTTVLARGDGRVSHSDEYWQNTLHQLLCCTIDLVAKATLAAEGQPRLTLEDLLAVVQSAAMAPSDLRSRRFRGGQCFHMLELVERHRQNLSDADFREVQRDIVYWLSEFPNIAEKTRSIIVSTLTSRADQWLRWPLREMLFSQSDHEASPLRCFEPDPITGRPKVIVLDAPVKLYKEVGRDAQILYKLIWQREAERRARRLLEQDGRAVSAFIWADEAHEIITRTDATFQSAARSAKVATVFLTQNLPGIVSAVGESGAFALLGSLQTKIFHANGDASTNEWAQRLFGEGEHSEHSLNVPYQGSGALSGSFRIGRRPEVPSLRFTMLQKAGSGRRAEAIFFHPGMRWGFPYSNHVLTAFPPVGQDN